MGVGDSGAGGEPAVTATRKPNAPLGITVRFTRAELVEVKRAARKRGYAQLAPYLRGLCQADIAIQELEKAGR